MALKIRSLILRIGTWIEIALAVFLVVVIVLLLGQMVFTDAPKVLDGTNNIQYFLSQCVLLAIGVEFIRMLCQHNVVSILDVLLFAIARGIILEHTSPVLTLVGVASIAGLFATRRFLITKGQDNTAHEDEQEKLDL